MPIIYTESSEKSGLSVFKKGALFKSGTYSIA